MLRQSTRIDICGAGIGLRAIRRDDWRIGWILEIPQRYVVYTVIDLELGTEL